MTAELIELKSKQSISSEADLSLIGQLKNEILLEKENFLRTDVKLKECKEKNKIEKEKHMNRVKELEVE